MLQLTTCRAVFHLCSVFEAEGEEQVSINGHDGTKDHWVVTEEIAHFCWSEKFTTPLYWLYCTKTIDLSANPENFHSFFTNAMYLPVEFTAFLTFLSCWKHVKSSLFSNNIFFFWKQRLMFWALHSQERNSCLKLFKQGMCQKPSASKSNQYRAL